MGGGCASLAGWRTAPVPGLMHRRGVRLGGERTHPPPPGAPGPGASPTGVGPQVAGEAVRSPEPRSLEARSSAGSWAGSGAGAATGPGAAQQDGRVFLDEPERGRKEDPTRELEPRSLHLGSAFLAVGAASLRRGSWEMATWGVGRSWGLAPAPQLATLCPRREQGQVLPEPRLSARPGAVPSAVGPPGPAGSSQASAGPAVGGEPSRPGLVSGSLVPRPPSLLGTGRELVHAQGVNHAPWQAPLLHNRKEFKEKPPR